MAETRRSRLVSARTLAVLIASTSFFAREAAAQSCDTGLNADLLIQNRHTALFVGGASPDPTRPDAGIFSINDPGRRISYRFTSPDTVSVASVWIYVHQIVTTGRLRVSVKDDQGGDPVSGSVSESSVFQPALGWQKVDLPAGSHKQLTECELYHVVIEPEDLSLFSATKYIDFITLISRFPVQFQPKDPSDYGLQSFFDLETAFLTRDPGARFVNPWTNPNYMPVPFFLLETDQATMIGQPFDDYDEELVLDDVQWGQRLVIDPSLPADVSVNYAAVFVRGQRQNQQDDLVVDLYDEAAQTVIATATAIGGGPGVLTRAHWFGAKLPSPVSLARGKAYYLLLRSDNVSPAYGYQVSVTRSTVPVPGGVQDPTYDPGGSYAVFSPNGGTTFFTHPNRDMPFLLANLDEPNGPLGVYDEGRLRHSDQSPALTANPGEGLKLHLTGRNIGEFGTIYYEAFNLHTGQVDAWSEAPVPEDTDNPFPIETITAPTTSGLLWKIEIRCGHLDFSHQRVQDDVVRFQVQIL